MPESAPLVSAAIESVPVVGHFRDGRFFNPGAGAHGFSQLWKWVTNRKPGPWRKWTPSTPGPTPPAQVQGAELRVTFVNHATVLLQTEGLNILTDPVWSFRVSPVGFAGPARHRDPGIRFADLPSIHCILISHNHYDHFDTPTLKRLARAHLPAVFCPLGLAKRLRGLGFRDVVEMDWGQSQPWKEMRVHCTEAQHFSARTPFDRNKTLWCGWVVETQHGNLYFAGDTGFGDFFAALRERFSTMRLALLPIGAYEPEWFMGPVHMTPEQAVEAASIVSATTSIGIHFGTFALADDGEAAPVERLRAALQGREDAERFRVLEEGEGHAVP
jgi:L-ascorbate metabolism protein UlaG (beta-lactamase superfamily)